ncbi:MAG: hypothetical protein WC527_08250 [Candidatus Margulisiibacteriota bacterium]
MLQSVSVKPRTINVRGSNFRDISGLLERRQFPTRRIEVPAGSTVTKHEYRQFLIDAYCAMAQFRVFAPSQGVDALELAHLIPRVHETMIAIYVGINKDVCHKGFVSPALVRHGHNNVYAFDPQVFSGKENVPDGTIDASAVLNGFEPPNKSWPKDWTYVMIKDPKRTMQSLWKQKGFISMVIGKHEDFQVKDGEACIFVDRDAFDHPMNKERAYLHGARQRGDKNLKHFVIPKGMEGEFDGLDPIILFPGERLLIASPILGRPCAHGWVENPMHKDDGTHAYVEEFSSTPKIVFPVSRKYAQLVKALTPAAGSADMTTDWFFQGLKVFRMALLAGIVEG